MDQTILSEDYIGMEKSPALQQDRSMVIRTNIKRFYIYFVLALVVVTFSVVRLGEVAMFERGHFLNPNSLGFAAETEDLVHNAREKLARKHVDLMVANDVSQPGAGFDADMNLVKLLDAKGGLEELPLLSKHEVAGRILDRVAKILAERAKG